MTPIKQSGITHGGAPVMSGIGLMATTYGIPLEITLAGLQSRGWICDWVDYYDTCVADGHNVATIRARVIAACTDTYGNKITTEIAARLDTLIEARNASCSTPK